MEIGSTLLVGIQFLCQETPGGESRLMTGIFGDLARSNLKSGSERAVEQIYKDKIRGSEAFYAALLKHVQFFDVDPNRPKVVVFNNCIIGVGGDASAEQFFEVKPGDVDKIKDIEEKVKCALRIYQDACFLYSDGSFLKFAKNSGGKAEITEIRGGVSTIGYGCLDAKSKLAKYINTEGPPTLTLENVYHDIDSVFADASKGGHFYVSRAYAGYIAFQDGKPVRYTSSHLPDKYNEGFTGRAADEETDVFVAVSRKSLQKRQETK